MDLSEVIATITRLEQERETIYADDRVTAQENPRLHELETELTRLWDLKRRLEAARAVGSDEPVVPQPKQMEDMDR
ncbi:MAG: hypothetical protein RLZZ387_5286 [Chloroflexota bacterium]|jgi:hypothetical protein